MNEPRLTSGNTGITSAGGAILTITVKDELKIGESIPPIRDVNLVPLLGDNLLSVSQLTTQWDTTAIFDKNGVKNYEVHLCNSPIRNYSQWKIAGWPLLGRSAGIPSF